MKEIKRCNNCMFLQDEEIEIVNYYNKGFNRESESEEEEVLSCDKKGFLTMQSLKKDCNLWEFDKNKKRLFEE